MRLLRCARNDEGLSDSSASTSSAWQLAEAVSLIRLDKLIGVEQVEGSDTTKMPRVSSAGNQKAFYLTFNPG